MFLRYWEEGLETQLLPNQGLHLMLSNSIFTSTSLIDILPLRVMDIILMEAKAELMVATNLTLISYLLTNSRSRLITQKSRATSVLSNTRMGTT